MSTHGTYETAGGRPAVRFERRIRHPVERVWRAVTDPAELARWFPCEVAVDLRPGGAMAFTFARDVVLDGEVLELDPPRAFAFRWGRDVLRLELSPEGDETRLTLLHVLHEEGEEAAAKTAAGWHVCLDGLERHLTGARDGDGEGPPSGSPTPEWDARHQEYVARGVPAGAPVPGRR